MKFNYEFNGQNNSATKYVIYLITNIISQKYYIGQTRRELRFRWNDYKRDLLKPIQIEKRSGTNIKLRRSTQKHFRKIGNTDFLHFSIIEIVDMSHLSTEEEKLFLLNLIEQHHIKEFRKLYGKPKVFNITDGGRQHICTEKEKEKIRQANKGKHYSPATEFKKGEMSGEKNPFYGKQHTEESREKMSKKLKGRKRKPHSLEAKIKIGLKNKGSYEEKFGLEKAISLKQNQSKERKGKTYEERCGEERAKIMHDKKRRHYNLITNPLVSPTGELFFEFKGLRCFCKKYNLDRMSLVKLLNNEQKFHKGWHLQNTIINNKKQ